MTITFPLAGLFTEHVIKTLAFDLVSRQETSRTAGGRLIAKDFSRAIWIGKFASTALNYDDAIDLEALLQSLDGSVQTFLAHDTRRPFPRFHANGWFNDTGVMTTINANRKAIALSGLAPHFRIARGDRLSFVHETGGRSLHAAVESVMANESGVTPQFEIRPHLPPSAFAGMPVTLKRPPCLMQIEPGSIAYTEGASTLGVVTFSAVQHL